jgi:PIN domain nuclease of toxin-antitoxin system
MPAVILDTHAAIWYLVEPTRLSTTARAAIEQAALAGDPVYLPSISLVEVQYLVDRGRIPQQVLDILHNAVVGPNAGLVLVPLDFGIARAVAQIPRTMVPDMPDRIIAATALMLHLPLVSRDRKIQASQITTIW